MKWSDRSGNRISTPLAWGLMGALAANQFGLTPEQGFLAGYVFGNSFFNSRSNAFTRLTNLNGLRRVFFVPNETWRRLENKQLGKRIGSEKTREWIEENINRETLDDIFNSVKCTLTNTPGSNCYFFNDTNRKQCISTRNKAKKLREKTGEVLSGISIYNMIFEFIPELYSKILLGYEVITFFYANRPCPGDS